MSSLSKCDMFLTDATRALNQCSFFVSAGTHGASQSLGVLSIGPNPRQTPALTSEFQQAACLGPAAQLFGREQVELAGDQAAAPASRPPQDGLEHPCSLGFRRPGAPPCPVEAPAFLRLESPGGRCSGARRHTALWTLSAALGGKAAGVNASFC